MRLREEVLKIELFRVLNELECSLAEDVGTSQKSIQLFSHAKEKIHGLLAKPKVDARHGPPTAALMDLLAALFSDQELRAFVAHRLPGGDKVVVRLPGTTCTLEHLVDQTAQLLVRQGLVTCGLFEALLAAAPGRRIAIGRVAVAWGLPEPSDRTSGA